MVIFINNNVYIFIDPSNKHNICHIFNRLKLYYNILIRYIDTSLASGCNCTEYQANKNCSKKQFYDPPLTCVLHYVILLQTSELKVNKHYLMVSEQMSVQCMNTYLLEFFLSVLILHMLFYLG